VEDYWEQLTRAGLTTDLNEEEGAGHHPHHLWAFPSMKWSCGILTYGTGA
jgi:hypothetical protein